MQRLKSVNQYGIQNLFNLDHFTSRYDHCLGVYLLLRNLNASREEQVAGLVHDIAHTAFSHVIDYVFNQAATQNVHEQFHREIIFNSPIPQIVHNYGLNIECIVDKHNYCLLEQDLPQLCADRVDYFLRDSLIYGISSPDEINLLFNSLATYQGEIVLTNQKAALMMAEKFMQTCVEFWSEPRQCGGYALMADIIRRAVDKKILT